MNDIDPLLTLLERQRDIPLADDGFSQRVLERLADAHSSAHRARRWILGAGVLIGGVATAYLAPPIEGVIVQEHGVDPALQPVLAMGLMGVLAACAAWAFIAADFREMKTS